MESVVSTGWLAFCDFQCFCGRGAFVGAGRRSLAPPLVSDGRRRRRHPGALVGEARAKRLRGILFCAKLTATVGLRASAPSPCSNIYSVITRRMHCAIRGKCPRITYASRRPIQPLVGRRKLLRQAVPGSRSSVLTVWSNIWLIIRCCWVTWAE